MSDEAKLTDISVGVETKAADIANHGAFAAANAAGTLACAHCNHGLSKVGLRNGEPGSGRMQRCPQCLNKFALIIDVKGEMHAFRDRREAAAAGF